MSTPLAPFDPPPPQLAEEVAPVPDPPPADPPADPPTDPPADPWYRRWGRALLRALRLAWRWLVRYPVALLAAAGVLVGVSLLAAWRRGDLGDFNVGGLLGWLFHGGEDKPEVVKAKVVVLPSEPGAAPTPASTAEILPAPGGPLRDKNKIRIKEEDGTVREVRLPQGVRDADVQQVLEVAPSEVKLKVIRRPDIGLTAEDINHLLVWAAAGLTAVGLILAAPAPAAAQECPPGFKCVPEEVAARQAAALKEYLCLQNSAGPLLTLDPFLVTIAEDGTLGVAPSLSGALKWCAWEYTLTAPVKVTIASKPAASKPAPPDWGWVPRWRAGLLLAPSVALDPAAPSDSAWEPALLFQAFHFKLVHLNAHAGWRSGGLGVGVDLTRNLDLSAGAALRWSTWSLAPFLGLSLALY